MKLPRQQQERLRERLHNKKLPIEERVKAHKDILDGVMNPKETFDPETFDPLDDVDDYDIKRRPRSEPPRRLPTMGMKPKQLLEGQMIGMYESKQDLYLLIAWLSERVSDLEDQLSNPS